MPKSLQSLALETHREEFGHGTWRVRGLLRQKFLAYVELEQWREAESMRFAIAMEDKRRKDWSFYVEDLTWMAAIYRRVGKDEIAAWMLRGAHAQLVELGYQREAGQIERALEVK